ncbi:signal peptidase I [Cryobacterium melibiosiphilum]|uniref:Signal peptidase I n=1 Tax=Cryobacterium melibiosiphilum TaxID=995039 RepID=A0A3A5MEE8_9MICO|nr:signal peptidase I [Cryobacterium melibiosiphilum]RJT85222.1 signal peptidase I [Cryobacterium melibiosiphilum]
MAGIRSVTRGRGDQHRGLGHYLGVALSAAVLLLVLALAVLLIVVPKVAGGIPLTVLTSSMEPGLPPGTLIVVAPVDPDTLQIGDVATYQIRSGEPGVITHRITQVISSSNGERSFIFQGDNNSDPDADVVLAEQIQGRLWYSLPFVGYVNNAVNGVNQAWIIPLGAGLLFLYAGWSIGRGIVTGVRGRRRHRMPTHRAD